ncbi:hypothetical protein QBC42DRAFT_288809 [Cladorrhinum samala]|uniref:F-box domain-containing protein n=1 Tax=Cladorrhinum samala TaxID=585594 RepID=A0AAV9HM91_9PEZI|nr:hypothetical protein QBC42DRAFT_288809 [Cladorrhinum samala]
MSSINIDCLPGVENIRAIIAHLDDKDVINLSITCKALRQQLAHRVFHTVQFTNEPRIADSALAAARNHGAHIRLLRFVGYASEEDDDANSKADYGDTTSAVWPNRDLLPKSAVMLLQANKTLLPNLETIAINFDHDYGEHSEFGPYGVKMFANTESWADVRMREARMTMCRLWANTYMALTKNEGTPGLVIENWSPRGVITFKSSQWKEYMGRVKSFDVRVIVDTFAFEFTNSMEGYVKDFAAMQEFFFDHLDSAETLKVSMLWPDTPFGMHGEYHLPLPIKAEGCMQALERVEFRHVFVSREMIEFFKGHKDNLRTVILHDAQSAAAEYGECATRPLSWAVFFDLLSAASDEDEIALSDLIFTTSAPLSETEGKTGKINYKSERAAIKKVRDELRTNPRRRLFGYGDLGEQNGMFIHDVKTNQESAISGRDQAAHDRFVEKLRQRNEQARLNTYTAEVSRRVDTDIAEQLVQGLETMSGIGHRVSDGSGPAGSQDVDTVQGVDDDATRVTAEAQEQNELPSVTKKKTTVRKRREVAVTQNTEVRRSARLARKLES